MRVVEEDDLKSEFGRAEFERAPHERVCYLLAPPEVASSLVHQQSSWWWGGKNNFAYKHKHLHMHTNPCTCTQIHAHTHALNVVNMFPINIMETITPVISGRSIWVPGGYLESRSWLNQIYGYEHMSMMRNIIPSSNKETTILSIDPHHMYQDV